MPQESENELFTRRQAAKRQGRSYETISQWERNGWLTPAADKPKRYTAEALDDAAAKADEAQREARLKASRASRARGDKYNRPGRMVLRDGAERLKVNLHTMRNWLLSCPYLPKGRGITHWPENTEVGSNVPVYVAIADIETIESKIKGDAKSAAIERLRPVRQKNMLAAQQKSVAKRYPKPGEGLGNAETAAGWVGVSTPMIHRAHKKGGLKSASKDPLRFSRKVVERWMEDQIKGKDDFSIADIAQKLDGPPGKTNKAGRYQKHQIIADIINRLELETYKKLAPDKLNRMREFLCISSGLFPKVETAYLALIGEADELRPGETKIRDEAELYSESLGGIIEAQKIIRERLAEHAPADCVRTVTQIVGSGQGRHRHKADVAPKAAIEAALRGKNWTPPAETPAPPPAANGKPADEADPQVDGPIPAATPTRDETAYRPMSELWPLRPDEFSSSGQCSRFLDQHSEEIDSFKPSPRRRMVHVGQWMAYWRNHDANEFASMDQEPGETKKAELWQRAERERRRKTDF